jgi:hypothetical protein
MMRCITPCDASHVDGLGNAIRHDKLPRLDFHCLSLKLEWSISQFAASQLLHPQFMLKYIDVYGVISDLRMFSHTRCQ